MTPSPPAAVHVLTKSMLQQPATPGILLFVFASSGAVKLVSRLEFVSAKILRRLLFIAAAFVLMSCAQGGFLAVALGDDGQNSPQLPEDDVTLECAWAPSPQHQLIQAKKTYFERAIHPETQLVRYVDVAQRSAERELMLEAWREPRTTRGPPGA